MKQQKKRQGKRASLRERLSGLFSSSESTESPPEGFAVSNPTDFRRGEPEKDNLGEVGGTTSSSKKTSAHETVSSRMQQLDKISETAEQPLNEVRARAQSIINAKKILSEANKAEEFQDDMELTLQRPSKVVESQSTQRSSAVSSRQGKIHEGASKEYSSTKLLLDSEAAEAAKEEAEDSEATHKTIKDLENDLEGMREKIVQITNELGQLTGKLIFNQKIKELGELNGQAVKLQNLITDRKISFIVNNGGKKPLDSVIELAKDSLPYAIEAIEIEYQNSLNIKQEKTGREFAALSGQGIRPPPIESSSSASEYGDPSKHPASATGNYLNFTKQTWTVDSGIDIYDNATNIKHNPDVIVQEGETAATTSSTPSPPAESSASHSPDSSASAKSTIAPNIPTDPGDNPLRDKKMQEQPPNINSEHTLSDEQITASAAKRRSKMIAPGSSTSSPQSERNKKLPAAAAASQAALSNTNVNDDPAEKHSRRSIIGTPILTKKTK